MTSLVFHNGRLWAGTGDGVSSTENHELFRYWAGGRWLLENEVIGLAVDSRGDSYALTESGISGIHFKSMTLQDKAEDRKSTRLNSSHVAISYAVFCLKKKTKRTKQIHD